MPIKITPSHVAVLVPSVRKAAERLKQFGFQIGKEEVWDGEGTREIYVERGRQNSLLLMEAIGPGAYQRAFAKRGPGLHHLAVDVLNLEEFLESLTGSGWLLHPISVKTIRKTQTAYLARPGFPALIEVQQRESLSDGSLFVSEVAVPLDSKLTALLPFIGLDKIVQISAGEVQFKMSGETITMRDLL